jgi:hypothetical protein
MTEIAQLVDEVLSHYGDAHRFEFVADMPLGTSRLC